jgi:hypothetical protein
MASRVEPFSSGLDLSDAHELGDRLPVTGDDDLVLALQESASTLGQRWRKSRTVIVFMA